MGTYNWIWQTTLIFFVGKIILRIAGRKSISQMTITQVIVMIGIGSLLIQPVSGKGLLVTFLVALLITILMLITEYLEMKFDLIESIATGKALIIIENGEINYRNLKKLRMSVDRLETRLRQSGIPSIEDVKYATIEVSGQLGYEIKDNKKPITRDDFLILMNEFYDNDKNTEKLFKKLSSHNSNIFSEVVKKER